VYCKGKAKKGIVKQRSVLQRQSRAKFSKEIFVLRRWKMNDYEKENPLLQYDDYPESWGYHIVSGMEDDEDDNYDPEEEDDEWQTYIRR
jgi:hypothetical protein